MRQTIFKEGSDEANPCGNAHSAYCRGHFYTHMNTKELLMRDKYHGHADAGSLENDLMRIAAGEPIDYVIGWKPFCGIEADLSLQPIIPREETEYWVSECIRFLGS